MKRVLVMLAALLLLWACCGNSAVRAEALQEALSSETTILSNESGEDRMEEPELYRELATDDWFPLLAAGVISAAAAGVIAGMILFVRRKKK